MKIAASAPDPWLELCAEGLVARVGARMAADAQRAAALRERAALAARCLAERLGATRVWLFGSLAWGEPHERSDVDLLVEGLLSSEWSRAIGCAEEIVGAPLDLVRLEEAPAALVERVQRDGLLLHGRR